MQFFAGYMKTRHCVSIHFPRVLLWAGRAPWGFFFVFLSFVGGGAQRRTDRHVDLRQSNSKFKSKPTIDLHLCASHCHSSCSRKNIGNHKKHTRTTIQANKTSLQLELVINVTPPPQFSLAHTVSPQRLEKRKRERD
jgi:hypothetical protein